MRITKTWIGVLLLFASCASPHPDLNDNPDFWTWETYLGDPTSSQYSSLDQINSENVSRLDVAWMYHTGDSPGGRGWQNNPLIVDSTLFGVSGEGKVFALNAATGIEIWRFDPYEEGAEIGQGQGAVRGLIYWSSGEDRRIFSLAGSILVALNADTGAPVASFGNAGTIDLHDGLGRDVSGLQVVATTPGIVYKNLMIQGTRVDEYMNAAPGHIRAYDVITGEIKWIFHTIPQKGEFGYDTWPEGAPERLGGANAWCGFSLDVERGIVFAATGSASFDFWGGNRAGENLFANSVLALDADTGERIWHFQTVHHDIWDRDLPAPPNLVTVEHDGQRVDAVAQVTKSGYIFLLDRETGEPLFPVEEVPVPPSDLIGEEAWPTQPIPTKPPPFARQRFDEADITDRTPEAHAFVLDMYRQFRSGRQFIPPSVQGTIIFPGFDGGAEWGGAAFDPSTGMLYINANEMPRILQMIELAAENVSSPRGLYTNYCAGCHGPDMRGSADRSYPSVEGIGDRMTEAEIRGRIEEGKGMMPGFRFLTDAEKSAIVDFVLYRVGENSANMAQIVADRFMTGDSGYINNGWKKFLDPDGYPAIKPPWGTLTAVDLNEGTIVWTVPLGDFPELVAPGNPPTGTENYGGPVVTAGGILFIGATKDEKFRAFDLRTGEVLWEAELPAGGYATPATYEVDGRQYVVIAAGGGRDTKPGDAYVAFALPK